MARIVNWRDAGYSWIGIWRHLLVNKICWRDGAEGSEKAIRRAYRAELALRQQEGVGAATTLVASPSGAGDSTSRGEEVEFCSSTSPHQYRASEELQFHELFGLASLTAARKLEFTPSIHSVFNA
jgi:hypothetical protein